MACRIVVTFRAPATDEQCRATMAEQGDRQISKSLTKSRTYTIFVPKGTERSRLTHYFSLSTVQWVEVQQE